MVSLTARRPNIFTAQTNYDAFPNDIAEYRDFARRPILTVASFHCSSSLGLDFLFGNVASSRPCQRLIYDA
jgi:hypothetical protein